jgi:hypothetical protein
MGNTNLPVIRCVNESLISQANLLIGQLEDNGCPQKILDQLREWNFDRAIDLAKLKKWKEWAK